MMGEKFQKINVVALQFIMILLLTACASKSVGTTWQEQYDLGIQYLTDGDYEEAIVAFTAAIEIDPKQTSAYIGRGDAYIQSGESEENLALAQTDYETVLELDETVQEAYLGLSDICVLRGDYDSALDMLKTGLEKAEETEVILERIPNTLLEYYDLALEQPEDGDYETTIAILTKIIDFTNEMESDDETLRDLLIDSYISRGDAYAKSGDTEENLALAMADYLTALELDETDARVYLGIADVYIRQGDYDSALEILREGLEKAGNTEEIETKIEEIEAGNITDSSGNLRRMSSYDATGALMWYHEYTYNANGRLASVSSYDGSGSQTGHVDFEYDEDGRSAVSYHQSNDTGAVGKIEYVYDGSGYVIQSNWYEIDGTLERIVINNYDSEGRLITEENYSPEGELYYTEFYEYNEQGQMVKIIYSHPSGYESYTLYEYTSEGYIISISQYSNGELTRVHENIFDGVGNCIGYKIYDGDGNLIQTILYE